MAAVWVNPAGEAGQAAECLKVNQLRTSPKTCTRRCRVAIRRGPPRWRGGWVTAARDGRLRKPAPGGGCASCLSRTFHRFRCTRCLFRMCGFGVRLRQHEHSCRISRKALRALESFPVQANGRVSAPGCVPTGVVRRDETAATLRTLPAISSAVAVPSLLEDVPFVWSGDVSAGVPCLVVSCSAADKRPAWRGRESAASWSGAGASRPVPGGASRASYQLFPSFPAVVAAGFAVASNRTGWGNT